MRIASAIIKARILYCASCLPLSWAVVCDFSQQYQPTLLAPGAEVGGRTGRRGGGSGRRGGGGSDRRGGGSGEVVTLDTAELRELISQ